MKYTNTLENTRVKNKETATHNMDRAFHLFYAICLRN